MILCDYGCGKESKFILKNGKNCCENWYTKCISNRTKNSKGLSKAHKEGKMPKVLFGGKQGWAKGKNSFNDERIKRSYELTENTFRIYNKNEKLPPIKYILIINNLLEYKCICGIHEWNNKKLVLHLDHINGNRLDNRLTNLRFLCPNCHSQTETYCRSNGKEKFCIEDIKNELIKNNGIINSTLTSLGLAPGGTNWNKCKKILESISEYGGTADT